MVDLEELDFKLEGSLKAGSFLEVCDVLNKVLPDFGIKIKYIKSGNIEVFGTGGGIKF